MISGVRGMFFSTAWGALIFGAGLIFTADPARGDVQFMGLDQSPLDTATRIHPREIHGAWALGSGPLGGSQGGGNPLAGWRPFVAGASLQKPNSNPIREFVMPEFSFGGAGGPTSRKPRFQDSPSADPVGNSSLTNGVNSFPLFDDNGNLISYSGPNGYFQGTTRLTHNPYDAWLSAASIAALLNGSTNDSNDTSNTTTGYASLDQNLASDQTVSLDDPFGAANLLHFASNFNAIPSPSTGSLLVISAMALIRRKCVCR